MRYLFIICAVFVVVATASAGTPKSSVFKSKRLCAAAQFQTPSVPAHGNVTVSVSVAGKPINGAVLSRHVVEWSGRGVIVRIVQQSVRAPLVVRAASVREGCVTLNLLASW